MRRAHVYIGSFVDRSKKPVVPSHTNFVTPGIATGGTGMSPHW